MLCVIGGTGFSELAGLTDIVSESVSTEYGGAYIERGMLHGKQCYFIPRHGHPAHVPPHKINYRANIKALHQLNVTEIIAVTAVGSVAPSLAVSEIVVPLQIIDYSYGRAHTFFDDEISHIDFTYPYDEGVRQRLIDAVKQVPDAKLCRDGVYACTQGPRLESAAEIERLAKDGCTIVGMTAMPEAALARELSIAYGGISVVVNEGAGISPVAIDIEGIKANLNLGMSHVAAAIGHMLK